MRTFRRKAKKALLYAEKLGKDKLERIERANSELSQMAQKVIRKVPRICESIRHQIHRLSRPQRKQAKRLGRELCELKELTERLIHQNAQRFSGHHTARKLYSLDEPHVVAIKKGKQGKPAEYGSKVSLTVDRNGFVVTHREYCTNLADVNTLLDVVEGWQKTFGKVPREQGGDRGFHHPEKSQKDFGAQEISRLSIPYKGKRKHPDSGSPWFKRLQRARASIEPIISHPSLIPRFHSIPMNRVSFRTRNRRALLPNMRLFGWVSSPPCCRYANKIASLGLQYKASL